MLATVEEYMLLISHMGLMMSYTSAFFSNVVIVFRFLLFLI